MEADGVTQLFGGSPGNFSRGARASGFLARAPFENVEAMSQCSSLLT
jgi:hypothetical protein